MINGRPIYACVALKLLPVALLVDKVLLEKELDPELEVPPPGPEELPDELPLPTVVELPTVSLSFTPAWYERLLTVAAPDISEMSFAVSRSLTPKKQRIPQLPMNDRQVFS